MFTFFSFTISGISYLVPNTFTPSMLLFSLFLLSSIIPTILYLSFIVLLTANIISLAPIPAPIINKFSILFGSFSAFFGLFTFDILDNIDLPAILYNTNIPDMNIPDNMFILAPK